MVFLQYNIFYVWPYPQFEKNLCHKNYIYAVFLLYDFSYEKLV